MYSMIIPQARVGGNAVARRTGIYKMLFAAFVALVTTATASAISADGWASQGNGTTGTIGGTGGTVVTVSDETAFLTYATTNTNPYIIRVVGSLDLGEDEHVVKSNKTIVGVGTTAEIVGTLKLNGSSKNIIFKNLTMTSSDADDRDAISIRGGTNVWIDHCTFYDAVDGLVDLSLGADFVTISWCRFYYTADFGHNLVTLIGSNNAHGDTDEGRLNTTLHHNWYGSNCSGRMPMARFGKIHSYNNYYNSAGCNMYFGLAWMSEFLVQNSYFESGNPDTAKVWYYYETNAKLKQTGNDFHPNLLVNSTGGNDTVFTPPYSYTLDPVSGVKAAVMAGAGPNGDEGTSAIVSLTLINADTDLPIAGYDPFVTGTTLDLSQLPTTNLNVRANVNGTVGSVRFGLNGNSNYRTENGAPYALAGDSSGDYNALTPPVGSYTMSATAWSGSGASGTNLGSLQISFTVVP